NERHLRLERDDVCKILFWPDAEVHAAGFNRFPQNRNNRLIPGLIRQKVIRSKESARLREIFDEAPKFPVRQPGRESVVKLGRAPGNVEQNGEQKSCSGKEQNCTATDFRGWHSCTARF